MALSLHTLKSSPTKTKKRLGRGNSSKGTYSGKGIKGQRSRAGGKGGLKRLGVKGYLKQIPKTRGFTSMHSPFEVINIATLEKLDKKVTKVDLKFLKNARLISNGLKVKILGNGELTRKFEVTAHAFSKTAEKAIEKAGGKVIVIKKPVPAKKEEKKEAKK